MLRSRQFRFVATLIALFGMLFMQLAVASYACPVLQVALGGEAIAAPAGTADHGMTGCRGMDEAQPNLCHTHDQAGHQSLDKPGLPQVQPFVAAGPALPVEAPVLVYLPDVTPRDTARLTHATAPPLSIRNCCFRI